MRLFLARNAFPLAVGAVAVAFLGLFFLLPLLKVFGASILDASGKSFTLANYVNVLSNRFFLNGLTNSLAIAAAASRLHRAGRRAVCLLPGAAADRRQAGAARARRAAAGAALVRRRLCAGAAVRPLRHRDRRAAVARHSVRVDLRREGHRRRLHADALSLCRAAGHAPPSSRSIFRSRRPRKTSAPRARACCAPSRCRWCCRRSSPAGLLVFIEALENFGVPFVLAEDRPILSVEAYKLFVGETTDNPASAGVLGVLLVVCTVVALLIQRGVLARRHYATGARRSAPLMQVSPALRRLGAAYCWIVVGCRAGAVRRRRGDLVHAVQRAGAAFRPFDSTISRNCSSARTGRSPTRCCWRRWRPAARR